MQRLTGEGQEVELIRHIFLERLPVEYHNILAAGGAETSIEKLATIADNIADLTSHNTFSISNMRTPELADSMDKILEELRKLEVWMAQVERRLDMRSKSPSQGRGRDKGSRKAPMRRLH